MHHLVLKMSSKNPAILMRYDAAAGVLAANFTFRWEICRSEMREWSPTTVSAIRQNFWK
jgi:hypothetical protein